MKEFTVFASDKALTGAVHILFFLGMATRKLGIETRNARLAALAPRVVITSFQVLPKPVARPTVAGQPLAKVDPGTSWNMTKFGEIQFGVHAIGMATNEGEGTAFITVVPGRVRSFTGLRRRSSLWSFRR